MVKTTGVHMAGCPDILACCTGLFVAIEVKRPGVGRVSKIQQRRIDQIRKAGGIAFVATCCDDVSAMLEGLRDAQKQEPAGPRV